MARPSQLPITAPLAWEQVQFASYVGSREHKAERWWGGLPGAKIGPDWVARRQGKELTTICRLVDPADQKLATTWVRRALRLGQYRYYEGDKIYPKHVWFRDGDRQYWFGFCINGIAGTYKGWPIDEEEKVATFG